MQPNESVDDAPLLVDVPKAAQRLGLGRSKLYELLATGEIESVTIGRRRLIPRDALDAYVAALRDQS